MEITRGFSPFFFVFYDCAKLMHLGADKRDYCAGSLMAYGALALLVSAVNSVFCYAVDPLNKAQTVVNMMGLCGWTENGAAAAFLQQALFLFLVMVFLHALLLAQPYWYGWLADGLLAAVICVFTPIEPLRRVLAGFFGIIMFNSSALLHLSLIHISSRKSRKPFKSSLLSTAAVSAFSIRFRRWRKRRGASAA